MAAELPDEAAGRAPGRGRLNGRRVLVVGAGTRATADPDAPIGNGRAIATLAAREGAMVACADRDEAAALATAEPRCSSATSPTPRTAPRSSPEPRRASARSTGWC